MLPTRDRTLLEAFAMGHLANVAMPPLPPAAPLLPTSPRKGDLRFSSIPSFRPCCSRLRGSRPPRHLICSLATFSEVAAAA